MSDGQLAQNAGSVARSCVPVEVVGAVSAFVVAEREGDAVPVQR
jgi:hypothetical protein